MLTGLIVSTYKGIAELALWVMIVIGAVAGFSLGKATDHALLGLVIGAVGTFLFLAIVLGAALILDDIHTRVASIEERLTGGEQPRRIGEDDPIAAGPSLAGLKSYEGLAKRLSALGMTADEIAMQMESRGLAAADAATLAKKVRGMAGADSHAKAARVLAGDGYSEGEIVARLQSQGVEHGDALSLASEVSARSAPAGEVGRQAPPRDAEARDRTQGSAVTPSLKPQLTPRFCRVCGHAKEDGAAFCEACGLPFGQPRTSDP